MGKTLSRSSSCMGKTSSRSPSFEVRTASSKNPTYLKDFTESKIGDSSRVTSPFNQSGGVNTIGNTSLTSVASRGGLSFETGKSTTDEPSTTTVSRTKDLSPRSLVSQSDLSTVVTGTISSAFPFQRTWSADAALLNTASHNQGLMTEALRLHLYTSAQAISHGSQGQESLTAATRKALLVKQQKANMFDVETTGPASRLALAHSSLDDGERDGTNRHALADGKLVKRKEDNRNCLRLPICFGSRKLMEQVYTFTSSELAETSRQLSKLDTSNYFPKSRILPSQDRSTRGSFRSTRGCLRQQTGKLEEEENETGDYVASDLSGIESLYEYEYDSEAHKSVVYHECGSDPVRELKVMVHDAPPEKVREGLIEYNKVVIKVEASTVSPTDCAIRSGKMSDEFNVSAPATPGVDAVGKIYRIDRESSAAYKLEVGDRVISLIKWGGNSRFLTVDPAKLVKVSDELDPAEAACLVETYLHAFQLVHSGQGKALRYRTNALQDKRVLVVGEMASNLGKAILQLLNLAGCHNVVATASDKNYDHLSEMKVMLIDPEPLQWNSFMHSSVDLLIQLSGQLSPAVVYGVLRPTGSMVIATSYNKAGERMGGAPTSAKMVVCARPDFSLDARVIRYNVFRAWDENWEFIQDDLRHLTSLLERDRKSVV